MECKEPVRVLQIIGIACNGGVESVILNYYRHIDKSKVQFDFVVHMLPPSFRNGHWNLAQISEYLTEGAGSPIAYHPDAVEIA
ncbi:MAG: hypothetical protein IIW84_03645, partial [Selenomonadaceae bacterium]|nr:hypothetical protein [Selenomonadaceae bacterium]